MKGIKEYIEAFGYKVLDWQQNDPSVGIPEGWVIFETEDQILECCYDHAQYHEWKKSDQETFLNDCKPNEDDL